MKNFWYEFKSCREIPTNDSSRYTTTISKSDSHIYKSKEKVDLGFTLDIDVVNKIVFVKFINKNDDSELGVLSLKCNEVYSTTYEVSEEIKNTLTGYLDASPFSNYLLTIELRHDLYSKQIYTVSFDHRLFVSRFDVDSIEFKLNEEMYLEKEDTVRTTEEDKTVYEPPMLEELTNAIANSLQIGRDKVKWDNTDGLKLQVSSGIKKGGDMVKKYDVYILEPMKRCSKSLGDGFYVYDANRLMESITGRKLLCEYIDYFRQNYWNGDQTLFLKTKQLLGQFSSSDISPKEKKELFKDEMEDLRKNKECFVLTNKKCEMFKSLNPKLTKAFTSSTFATYNYDLEAKEVRKSKRVILISER